MKAKIKVALKEHIKVHSFPDMSGTVLFDTVSGATIGLTLSGGELQQSLSTGKLLDRLDAETAASLAHFVITD